MTDEIVEILVIEGAATISITEPSQQVSVALSEQIAATTNPLPKGGTSGQVLAKQSAADYDVAWSSFDDLTIWMNNQLI